MGGSRLLEIRFLQTLSERVADNVNLLECDVEGAILQVLYGLTILFSRSHHTTSIP